MADNLNQQLLILLGKLALIKGLTLNSRLELEELVDNHNLKRVYYDDDTVTKLNQAINIIDHSEDWISDVIYEITSIEFIKNLTDDQQK